MEVNNDTPLDKAIESMNEASNKAIEIEDKTVKKIGRPTKMTDQMQKKVVRLAKELFFIRAISGEAGISVDTIERHLNNEDFKHFAVAFTHARNKFIAYHQNKLMEYASDKKTKDWRAEAHILTLCDKEYSERKYLTDAVTNQDAKILMQINAEKLTLAKEEGKIMLSGNSKSESISLKLFQPDKTKKKDNKEPKSE